MDLAPIRRRCPTAVARFARFRRHDVVGGGFLSGATVRPLIDDPGDDTYRWLLVLDGSGWAWDEHDHRHTLTPGTLFVRAPHTRHRIERAQDGRWLEFFLLLPEHLHTSLVDIGAIDPARRWCRVALTDALLRRLVHCTEQLRQSGGTDHQASVLATVADLLATVERAAERGDERLETVRHLLESDWTLPIATISTRIGMSTEGLRLAFRKRYGSTPLAWRIRTRLARAQEALLQGASVSEAAAAAGYGDPFTFSKQFRKTLGQPPSRCVSR